MCASGVRMWIFRSAHVRPEDPQEFTCASLRILRGPHVRPLRILRSAHVRSCAPMMILRSSHVRPMGILRSGVHMCATEDPQEMFCFRSLCVSIDVSLFPKPPLSVI